MLETTDAGGGIGHRAWLGFGHVDQLLGRLGRHFRAHRQRARSGADQCNRGKRFFRIETHLRLVDRRVIGKRHRSNQQRVAVGQRVRGDFSADDAAGAAAVIDHHLLAEQRAHVIGHDATDDVVAAARGKGHDDPHRFGRLPGRTLLRR